MHKGTLRGPEGSGISSFWTRCRFDEVIFKLKCGDGLGRVGLSHGIIFCIFVKLFVYLFSHFYRNVLSRLFRGNRLPKVMSAFKLRLFGSVEVFFEGHEKLRLLMLQHCCSCGLNFYKKRDLLQSSYFFLRAHNRKIFLGI